MNKYHILIIDDDQNHLNIIKELIEEIGSSVIQISTEKSGMEALELLKHKFNFNLIIVDIMLHDIDGTTLAKYIHNNEMLKRTYILMLSSSKNRVDIRKAKKAGADGYLVKPLELTESKREAFRKVIMSIKRGKEKNRGFKEYDL